MKKETQKVKKLRLSQETLRKLDPIKEDALNVAGAATVASGTSCTSDCGTICTLSPVTYC